MNDVSRCNVLIVEDEPLLAMDIEMMLSDAGFNVVGPAATTEQAFRLIAAERPDLTILDLNLGDETAFSVIDHLADTGQQFVVVSGHSQDLIPARHRGRPYLAKPYDAEVLLGMVRKLLRSEEYAMRFSHA